MGILEAVLYGIVQGITEWLPISSTAHLRLVPVALGQPDPGAGFTAVIQLGTLLAVLLYFGKDLWRVFKGWVQSLKPGGDRTSLEARMGWAILVGTIPIVVCGKLFESSIKSELRSLTVIAWSLILIGILLGLVDRVSKAKLGINDVTVGRGLVVGLCQAVALIPGSSRSGTTLIGGMLQGFDRATAARFSFLLSVPSVFAAGIKELIDERAQLAAPGWMPVIVATVVSFVVGYATIAWFLKYLGQRSTLIFSAYRVVLGLVLLGLIQTHHLSPQAGLPTKTAPVTGR